MSKEQSIGEKTELLREGERLDDLQRCGFMLIQNPSWFCFGIDAVLLSSFANIKPGAKCLDLGCGNGVIPILLSGKTKGEHFTGLEIQQDIADMARRSVIYNKISDRVEIVTGDIKDAGKLFAASSFDVVTSNPPYLTKEKGKSNEAGHKAVARHELLCTLEDVVAAAACMLRPGGHFFMVHRPFRLAEIIQTMAAHKIEPKRMRLVHPYVDKEPNMVLIEGTRGGNSGMVIEPPLIVYKQDRTYTDDLKKMYYE